MFFIYKTILKSLFGASLMFSMFAATSQKANADTVNNTTSTSNTLSTASHTVNNNKITVIAGDTLYWISQNHNTSVDTLMKVNNLTSTVIFPGQVLTLSGNTTSTQTQTNTAPAQTTNSSTTQNNTAQTQSTQTKPTQSTNTTQAATSNNSSAKAWIAGHESGGSYTAQNGQYYGKYQLSSSYLNGDYSPAHQEQVADQYVQSRYGSWDAAKAHWLNNGWY